MRKPNHVLKAVYDARPLRTDREQYLEDSLFRESPYHSLRVQNIRHANPHLARRLANYENTLFADQMRSLRGKEYLPLTNLAGQSLRGQFVFPAHAYSFNPNPRTIGGSTAPDIPMNLKTGLPLNLFGFKGRTPQRFGKNIQEEGIIYGDLNEEDVVQLNKLPLRHDDLREAGRALLPTHHGRLLGRARADKIEEAMRILMEAEIPPVLFNQEMLDLENIHRADNPNLTNPGYMGAYLQPFRQWEQGEGYRVRDLDRQEEMGLISPEQRMLMDDRLGQIDASGTIYRSEPIDIAMRLLKTSGYEYKPNFTMVGNRPKYGFVNKDKYGIPLTPHVYGELGNDGPIYDDENHRILIEGGTYMGDKKWNHAFAPREQITIPSLDIKLASEPMDIAMRLLKMPIVSDSPEVRQFDSGPAHIHQFQDPTTGEIMPLYISPASNPDSENLYAGIVGDNDDRASAKFNTGDGDYASLDGIETEEPYRRRGYMSAIYDAMDEYLQQNKTGRRLVPSGFQSDEGKAFWESRKKSEPMDIAMQLLKMPLIPYSLKEREGGYTGQFQDPITDEIMPLHLDGDIDEEYGISANIPERANTEVTGSSLFGSARATGDSATEPDYQRRGYMTALYDALAAMLDKKHSSTLYPNSVQSEEGRKFWGDKESWPVRDDILETGEPMEIAMRLLKMPQEAKDYATQIHEGQMYGEQPYMNHVENVASGFDDPHLQRIAYLHDTVEDSETGIGEIHERFGEDVGHAVDALTRRQGEQYFDYINRVKEHPEATQVKLADLHSNLKNNPNESLAKRYQKAIGILTNKSEPMNIAMRLLKEKKGLADDYDDDDLYNDDVPRQTYQEMFGEAPPEVHPGHMESLSRTRGIGTRHGIKLDSDYNIEDIPDKSLVDQAHDVSQAYHDAYMSGKYEPGEFGPWWQGLPKQSKTLGSEFADENLINRFRSEKHPDGSPVKDIIDVAALSGKEVPLHLNTVSLPDETGEITTAPSFYNMPYNEKTGFTRSEPMEIAMQLLKERVSPEAKRHKLEYDKKYESSPERVKYREELNRERRRRHIMGQGGPDMSHTSQHTIVPEDPHTNRARHFKDKGTLL